MFEDIMTKINNIEILCDENIYQIEDFTENSDHSYIARDLPYCITLKNIDKNIILEINHIYNLHLKTPIYVENSNHKWKKYVYKSIKYNKEINIIFININAKLISYHMNLMKFVIINQ